jgi:hypothetical protein
VPAPNLVVAEAQQPSLSLASGTLGAGSEWVRGSWPLSIAGDAPSGLCSISATVAGLGVGSTTSPQDTTKWRQCSATAVAATVDTMRFSDGADPFIATATSAAGNTATVTKTLDVDNSVPTVTLSGPADVPSGTEAAQMTATAAAGPSGVAGISCNVDGSTENFPVAGAPTTATATVDLSGIGAHSVSCLATNTAQDADGQATSSPVASRGMLIRRRTAASASFAKVLDRRVCRTVREKVRVPAGWHTIRWHHHKIRAKLPAHTARRNVRLCRERLEHRRIVVYRTVRRRHHRVRVKRHRTVRVPVAPHVIHKGVRTVGFGHATHLSGQLVTNRGRAIAHATVTIMAAPRNGNGDFHPLTSATTNRDGVWHAKIRRGPGRVLEAVYAGSATTEPAISDQVRTIVHARVKLGQIRPQRVPWHGRITLRGRLPGGHFPHRGINVRLEYGIGRQHTTYAVRQHVGARRASPNQKRRHGSRHRAASRHERFRAHFTFGAGPARVHARFFFRVCTLPSPRYPFAPGCSRKRMVRVGGHPHVTRHRRPHHRGRHHDHHRRHQQH